MDQESIKLNLVQTLPDTDLGIERLVEAMEDGVCVENLERQIVYINGAFAKLLGLTKQQIINRTCTEIFSESSLVIMPKLCSNLNYHDKKEQKEEVFSSSTGQRLRIRVSPIYDCFDKVSGYLMVIRDITNLIQREREMARAEQLALIGELVAGLAHEIRNPLAGIQGAMDILIERRGKNDPDRLVLENARQEVWRIDAAIRSLLERSRLRAMKLAPTSLAKVAKAAVILAQDQIAATNNNGTSKIEIIYLPHLDPMVIPIDAAQIEDAILNLILNAIEAIDQKGQVTISLSHSIKDGFHHEAIVEVKDNGKGIPPENLKKIFNPFFSTKADGTGLGLAAVRRILRAHKGRVEVDSIIDKGSVFRLYLPY